MNNEIQESVTSFEVSKLLKSKGFDVYTPYFYAKQNVKLFGIDEHSRYYPIVNTVKKLYDSASTAALKAEFYFYAPTHALAIEWIRVNFDIWIQGAFPLNNNKWEWVVFLLNEPLKNSDGFKNVMSLHHKPYYFNSPKEATEAALLYTLKKLI